MFLGPKGKGPGYSGPGPWALSGLALSLGAPLCIRSRVVTCDVP